MEVGHYHSWVVEEASLPSGLKALARNEKGLLMALAHESLPVAGVQFHPESVLTPEGRRLLQDWAEYAQRCLAISASKSNADLPTTGSSSDPEAAGITAARDAAAREARAALSIAIRATGDADPTLVRRLDARPVRSETLDVAAGTR